MIRKFDIRNTSGQTLARYHATNKRAALQRFMDDQAVTASQFKRMTIVPASAVTVVESECQG